MNPEKEAKLSISSILLIIGVSCLLFTAFMKLLNENIHPLFNRAGIVAIAAGLLLEALRFLVRHTVSGKKQTRKSPQ